MPETDLPIWTPSALRIEHSRLHHYMQWLRHERGLSFDGYPALWQWSVDHLEDFWASIWDYFALQSSVPHVRVLRSHDMPGGSWFEGARLNFAQQIFRFHDGDVSVVGGDTGDRAAIIAQSELRPMTRLSWRELRR